ncbi:MAG TPA: hypothetical protein VKT28_00120 [Puia sp.]|nr:hypothetical protein [Puia sp.]
MKCIITSIAFFAISATSLAQGAFSNNTSAGLEKVIQDYPNRFKNIKGEIIIENPQTTEYKSKIQIPGSSSCIVTRYSSSNNDVYSWGCVLTKTEDFNSARNKFKEIFGQIKNSIIKLHGEKPFILNGQYETPDEEKKFTTVIFELLPAVGEMKKIKVDLSLQYEIVGWKVSLTVYDHDKKDSEPGVASGN